MFPIIQLTLIFIDNTHVFLLHLFSKKSQTKCQTL